MLREQPQEGQPAAAQQWYEEFGDWEQATAIVVQAMGPGCHFDDLPNATIVQWYEAGASVTEAAAVAVKLLQAREAEYQQNVYGVDREQPKGPNEVAARYSEAQAKQAEFVYWHKVTSRLIRASEDEPDYVLSDIITADAYSWFQAGVTTMEAAALAVKLLDLQRGKQKGGCTVLTPMQQVTKAVNGQNPFIWQSNNAATLPVKRCRSCGRQALRDIRDGHATDCVYRIVQENQEAS